MVLELSGGETLTQALKAMAPFGRMIVCGQSGRKTALVDPWQLTVPNVSVTGFYLGAFLAFPDLIKSTLAELIGFVMTGKLLIQIGTVLPLSRAAEAHRLLEQRRTTGKVVLQPWVDA